MGRLEEMRRRRRRRRLKRLSAAAAVVAAAGGAAAGYQLTRPATVLHVAAARGGAEPVGPAATDGGTSGTTRTIGGTGAGSHRPGTGKAGTPGSPATTVATVDGTAGVQARWVIAENAKPGTTDWRIPSDPPGFISGFADHTSAVAGDTVQLYVSTDAPSFQVEAYRMGYYGGNGGRLVWTSAPADGVRQAKCPVQPVTNMVSCADWTPSLSFTVGSAFVPGDYLLKLAGTGGQQSYVPLTVRDPSSHAAYLVENDIYTWQAWNPYGGYDFYQGIGPCPYGGYPVCNRARVVSFDRPYGYEQGGADFLGNEYPLVRFAEQHGLDVTYETSADIERFPALLLQHRVLLSLGHDECWSYEERLSAEAAEAQGVNMIFFGASPILRHVRMEASPLGSYRQEVDYRNSASDPLDGTGQPREVTGNTWSDAPASWSEVPFVGAGYTGYVRPGYQPVAYRVYDGGSWLFAGTGLQTGSEIPGLLVSDFDQVMPGLSPDNVQVLAHSPMPLREVQTNVRDPASDTTYYTDPRSGAGVFDTGTVSWIPDLQASPLVGQMTSNLLALFGSGPAGPVQPSTGNWKSIYG